MGKDTRKKSNELSAAPVGDVGSGSATALRVESGEKVRSEVPVGLPPKYNVVLHDDNVTPMGFVIILLVKQFGYDEASASERVVAIQRDGQGVIGTYIRSVAEAKISLISEIAKQNGYPLEATIETAAV